jgi:hypothetical protein
MKVLARKIKNLSLLFPQDCQFLDNNELIKNKYYYNFLTTFVEEN